MSSPRRHREDKDREGRRGKARSRDRLPLSLRLVPAFILSVPPCLRGEPSFFNSHCRIRKLLQQPAVVRDLLQTLLDGLPTAYCWLTLSAQRERKRVHLILAVFLLLLPEPKPERDRKKERCHKQRNPG